MNEHPLMRTLDEVVDEHILNVLEHHDWNRTHTAKALGIGIRTLQRHIHRMRDKGIEIEDHAEYKKYLERKKSPLI